MTITASSLAYPQGGKVVQPVPHLGLGVLAHGARQDEHDVGGFGGIGPRAAGVLHDRPDNLGIARVHLAAVRLEKDTAILECPERCATGSR